MEISAGWANLFIAFAVILVVVFIFQTTRDVAKRSKRKDQGAYFDSGGYMATDITTSHHHHHDAGSSHGHAADGGHSAGSDGGGHGGH